MNWMLSEEMCTMKAYKFYNAVYGDGERMTGTLDEIYAAQQGRKVEISRSSGRTKCRMAWWP